MGPFLRLVSPLKLLTLDSFELINLANQTLRCRGLVIDETPQVRLLGLLLINHTIVAVLQV